MTRPTSLTFTAARAALATTALLAITLEATPASAGDARPQRSAWEATEWESGERALTPTDLQRATESTADQTSAPVVETGYTRMSAANLGTCDTGCPTCECAACAAKKKAKKPAGAESYKPVFYNNDFSYICDPCSNECYIGDSLKRMALGDSATLDLGGQYRARQQHEHNMRGLGLTGISDDFLLNRTRLFANLEVGSRFRAYAEYIDAVSFYERHNPRPIDENRSDMLNLFGDLKLYDGNSGDVWARVGRQELLYGEQRVISPLDWANTRRTFDGAKLFYKGEKWDIDAFWTRPVYPNKTQFDSPDESQEFGGIYTTYKGAENSTIDLYYLRFLEQSGTPFEFDTLGFRVKGAKNNWMWDVECDLQLGDYGGADHVAGAWTTGFGRQISDEGWKPAVWVYYDWASGDETPGNGYNHLFPLSHKYLGFMDFYGRRNIEDFNILATVDPTDKVRLLAWWHLFNLQDGDDVPASVAMTQSPTPPGNLVPGGDQYLGQELDLMAEWNFAPRQALVLGYSHYFTGDWYSTNPSAGLFDGDADFLWTQYHFNF